MDDFFTTHDTAIRAVAGFWAFLAVLYLLARYTKAELSQGNNRQLQRTLQIIFGAMALIWALVWIVVSQ